VLDSYATLVHILPGEPEARIAGPEKPLLGVPVDLGQALLLSEDLDHAGRGDDPLARDVVRLLLVHLARQVARSETGHSSTGEQRARRPAISVPRSASANVDRTLEL
jgi:hypothetical protein